MAWCFAAQFGWLDFLENKTIDWRFRVRGELDAPVKWIRPVPSPTLMYYYCKQFDKETVNEYRHKYFFLFLFKGPKLSMPLRFLKMPYRQLQFNKSIFYAKKLLKLGKRTQ